MQQFILQSINWKKKIIFLNTVKRLGKKSTSILPPRTMWFGIFGAAIPKLYSNKQRGIPNFRIIKSIVFSGG